MKTIAGILTLAAAAEIAPAGRDDAEAMVQYLKSRK